MLIDYDDDNKDKGEGGITRWGQVCVRMYADIMPYMNGYISWNPLSIC